MTTEVLTGSPDEVRSQYIERICERARKENWSLAELADTLRVSERTARRYLDQFGLDTALLIRPKKTDDA